MSILKLTKKFIDEVNKTNSIIDKQIIIRKYPELKKLFEYVYSPYIRYGITSANCEKLHYVIGINEYNDIFELLDALKDRKITGHAAISAVNSFVDDNNDYADIIYNIIDKNLKARIDAAIINKVFPKTVPEFSVALAKKYEDYAHKINFEKQSWFVSRKLDGLRCLAIPTTEGYKLYSRNGLEFKTLNKVATELDMLNANYVFDGEICIIDKNGDEDFQSIMRLYNRKDYTIEKPMYKIFDCLDIKDFELGKSTNIFSQRIDSLYKLKWSFDKYKYLSVVSQELIINKQMLEKAIEQAADLQWEGLMIRKDTIYEGKRTNNLLKIKQMHDAEFKVIGYEIGNMDTGSGIIEHILAKIFIDYKGYSVGVGSGFTIDERRAFAKNPDLIKNKSVTVKYFEETTNEKGGLSLRFPIFKGIRGAV